MTARSIMQHALSSALLTLSVFAGLGRGQTAAPPAAVAPAAIEQITAKGLEERAKILASDEMEGRRTGTRGQEAAAQMFAEHFERLGFEPLGDKQGGRRSWFQGYPVKLEDLDGEMTALFDPSGKRINEFGAWFLPRSKSKKVEIRGRLVFAGRADLEDLQLGGAIAVVHFDIKSKDGGDIYRSMGEGFRLMGQVRSLARQAKSAGAKACVLVSPSFPVAFLSAANMMTVYPGKPNVSLARRRNPSMRFGGTGPSIPTLALAGKDAEAVLKELGLATEHAFDPENDLAVGMKTKKAYRLAAVHQVEQKDALNVCAVLEGRDPKLKQEAIVFSCHMDHLGLAADGGSFNGADDNASGCATIFEIAEAFAKLEGDERPRRSVIFLVVSGEELGLWGSAHFADNPTWPESKIVANVNMDMLGRSTSRVPEDTVAVTPTFRNKDYSTLARSAARLGEQLGLKMGNGDRFYQRSDHWNFAKKGIPVVFFCDDEHADYHMPSDTWDKLEYGKMEKIARLAFLVGYEAANADGRPQKLGQQPDWFQGH